MDNSSRLDIPRGTPQGFFRNVVYCVYMQDEYKAKVSQLKDEVRALRQEQREDHARIKKLERTIDKIDELYHAIKAKMHH